MAAKIPVVSTTIGAEGLTVNPPHDIRIADTPQALRRPSAWNSSPAAKSATAYPAPPGEMVNANFSWEHVARCFETIMKTAPRLTQ